MKEAMVNLFGNYVHEIVFLHVLSAFIWVGGMIAVRFAVHPVMQSIDDSAIRLGKTLQITKNLFHIVMPFIAVLIVTAVLMAVGLGFRIAAVDESGNVINQTAYGIYQIVHAKEVIWMVMTANFTWMYFKRRKAQKLFDAGDLSAAKSAVAIVPKYLLPVNIALGVLALWLGVTLRGF